MTFHVKLAGILRYADATAAAAAHASMMAGRAGNAMLEGGARVAGDAIVFVFDDALSTSDSASTVDATESGIEQALETALTGSVVCSDESGRRREQHALGRPFWARRWKDGQTGFHEGRPNGLLEAHVARIETKPRARILVPLAGKAFDLRWLAERGHEVVGVECVFEAVRGFFDDWEIEPARSEIGRLPVLSAKGVTLVCGDMFAVSPADLGTFDVVYDRAALVALEPSTRARYVETCRSFLGDDGLTFLVAFGYDQAKAPGPPWSVDAATVSALHAPRAIEVLETRSESASKRFADAGVAAFEETAYLISR